MTIASTILAQLGGARFVSLTGAKNLIDHGKGLSFRLPGSGGFTKQGINYVRVDLKDSDTYDVEFSRVRGRKVTVLYRASDIYADQLQAVFTRETGLHTSLGIPAAEMRKFNNRHED